MTGISDDLNNNNKIDSLIAAIDAISGKSKVDPQQAAISKVMDNAQEQFDLDQIQQAKNAFNNVQLLTGDILTSEGDAKLQELKEHLKMAVTTGKLQEATRTFFQEKLNELVQKEEELPLTGWRSPDAQTHQLRLSLRYSNKVIYQLKKARLLSAFSKEDEAKLTQAKELLKTMSVAVQNYYKIIEKKVNKLENKSNQLTEAECAALVKEIGDLKKIYKKSQQFLIKTEKNYPDLFVDLDPELRSFISKEQYRTRLDRMHTAIEQATTHAKGRGTRSLLSLKKNNAATTKILKLAKNIRADFYTPLLSKNTEEQKTKNCNKLLNLLDRFYLPIKKDFETSTVEDLNSTLEAVDAIIEALNEIKKQSGRTKETMQVQKEIINTFIDKKIQSLTEAKSMIIEKEIAGRRNFAPQFNFEELAKQHDRNTDFFTDNERIENVIKGIEAVASFRELEKPMLPVGKIYAEYKELQPSRLQQQDNSARILFPEDLRPNPNADAATKELYTKNIDRLINALYSALSSGNLERDAQLVLQDKLNQLREIRETLSETSSSTVDNAPKEEQPEVKAATEKPIEGADAASKGWVAQFRELRKLKTQYEEAKRDAEDPFMDSETRSEARRRQEAIKQQLMKMPEGVKYLNRVTEREGGPP